jgi:hypothetical protein
MSGDPLFLYEGSVNNGEKMNEKKNRRNQGKQTDRKKEMNFINEMGTEEFNKRGHKDLPTETWAFLQLSKLIFYWKNLWNKELD